MEQLYINLSYTQVGIAALLIIINGIISLVLRLGLEKRLFLASVRTVVQLLVIGMVLHWVFALNRWYLVLILTGVMAIVAGIAAVNRTDRRYPGIFWNSIVSVWASSWFITAIALFGIIKVDPWYKPQYAIPLLGMILGNALNGISLGLNRLSEELYTNRSMIEAYLTLGATRWEAARLPVRNALRAGMIPIINVMMVVGIVSLPGMMTGQLLAGVEPVQAVKYQIVILFLIASGTSLGTLGCVLLSYRILFNDRHQFLYWLITERE